MGNPLPPGTPEGPGMKFCKDCGKQIMRKAEICPHCGCRQLPSPRKDSIDIFGQVERGVGEVVQSIGWKRVKFLFWLLMAFLALRGTVLFLREWSNDCGLDWAPWRFHGYGMWLIPCAVLLIGYIRWASKGKRNWLVWIALPMAAMAILGTLGSAWWEAACMESKMVRRQPQRVDADVEQQLPRLPPEVERIPVAKWVQVQVYLPKWDYITKLSCCKPGFRCQTQNEWVIGPNLAVDRSRIKNETESHQPMYIEQQYQTFSDDEKATVQAFCKSGFNIFQDVPMHKNLYGDFPDPHADRSQAVSVCVVTPTPASNLPADNDQGMRWGMSKEEVLQAFHRMAANDPDMKLEEVDTNAFVCRGHAMGIRDNNWYYFKEGKLVETRTINLDYPDSWYDETLEKLKKDYGQPVQGSIPPNLKPIRSDVFVSPRSLIILIVDKPEDCNGGACVSEIYLDSSQVGLAVR